MEHTYTYAGPSSVTTTAAGRAPALATSGGPEPHPFLYLGTPPEGRCVARGLLAVAAVARARYYEPPGSASRRAARDPMVTVHDDRLRFEAFSACNGVYARLDVPVSDGVAGRGTTNIDVNEPLRAALADVRAGEGMLVSVGFDQVTVTTRRGGALERRVPLPDRWLRGLAEVQLASAGMLARASLDAAGARRFVQRLPRRPGHGWLVPAAGTLRVAATPSEDGAWIDDLRRLEALRSVAAQLQGLQVHAGVDQPGPAAFAAELGGGVRLWLVASPKANRGFSGEGGVLAQALLTDPGVSDRLDALLDGQALLDPAALAAAAGLSTAEVHAGLAALGAAGRVGFDAHEARYFHRVLPFDLKSLGALHPRIEAARRLISDGAVRLAPGGLAEVRGGAGAYRVRLDEHPPRCTCRWFARHGGDRGPCKHVLAAQLAAAEQETGR